MVSKLGKNAEFAEVNIDDREALEANLTGLPDPSLFHTLNLRALYQMQLSIASYSIDEYGLSISNIIL